MRTLVVSYDERPRPAVVTPAKGSYGDCTDETMARDCDIGSIIARYGGNLAELARWRGSMSFGVQPLANLDDAIDQLKRADEVLRSLPNAPFKTLADAVSAINDGSFGRLVSGEKDVVEKDVEVVKDEAVKGE